MFSTFSLTLISLKEISNIANIQGHYYFEQNIINDSIDCVYEKQIFVKYST